MSNDHLLHESHITHLIYSGSKHFWRSRHNLDVYIALHPVVGVLEIICVDQLGLGNRTDKIPRLYLKLSGVDDRLDETGLESRIKAKEDVIHKMHSFVDVQAVVTAVRNEARAEYVLARLAISQQSPAAQRAPNVFSEANTVTNKAYRPVHIQMQAHFRDPVPSDVQLQMLLPNLPEGVTPYELPSTNTTITDNNCIESAWGQYSEQNDTEAMIPPTHIGDLPLLQAFSHAPCYQHEVFDSRKIDRKRKNGCSSEFTDINFASAADKFERQKSLEFCVEDDISVISEEDQEEDSATNNSSWNYSTSSAIPMSASKRQRSFKSLSNFTTADSNESIEAAVCSTDHHVSLAASAETSVGAVVGTNVTKQPIDLATLPFWTRLSDEGRKIEYNYSSNHHKDSSNSNDDSDMKDNLHRGKDEIIVKGDVDFHRAHNVQKITHIKYSIPLQHHLSTHYKTTKETAAASVDNGDSNDADDSDNSGKSRTILRPKSGLRLAPLIATHAATTSSNMHDRTEVAVLSPRLSSLPRVDTASAHHPTECGHNIGSLTSASILSPKKLRELQTADSVDHMSTASRSPLQLSPMIRGTSRHLATSASINHRSNVSSAVVPLATGTDIATIQEGHHHLRRQPSLGNKTPSISGMMDSLLSFASHFP